MRMPESFLSRMILACMPFMAYGFCGKDAWQGAALTVGVYWLSLFIFWFTRRLFPEGAARPVFFLWLGLWGQLAWTLAGILPFWTASVFFLVPSGFFDAGRSGKWESPSKRFKGIAPFAHRLPKYFGERILAGLGFYVSIYALAAAKGLADRIGHADPARSAGTVFFLIFLTSFIWKNQPAQKKPVPLPESKP